jgi:hypothetical protein
MDRYILSQSPAQEAIGQRRMQALIVMEKAGGAFGYGKAPDQVDLGEIFVSETWVADNKLSIWRKPEEEAKNFTMRSDVGEATPQYTAEQDRRPGILLLRRNRQSCRKLAVRGEGVSRVYGRAIDSHGHLAVDLRGVRPPSGLTDAFVAAEPCLPDRGAKAALD